MIELNDNLYKKISINIVIKSDEECWEWTGRKDKDGYGRIDANKKQWLAHRLMWEIKNGIIPSGMCVCHTCDNPSCVNPAHLFLGTHKDNAVDRQNKNRGKVQLNDNRGERHGMSILNEHQVLEIRDKYSSGAYTQKKLACEYGVTRGAVCDILNNKTWKHV